MEKKYWLNFIEEGIMNPLANEYIGGRIEVFDYDHEFDIDEIRFFTKKVAEFNKFRNKYELKDVTSDELNNIKQTVAERYLADWDTLESEMDRLSKKWGN